MQKLSVARAFGARVRTLRLQNGFSQEHLAERSRLHRTFIGRIERGETNVTLANIHKIAKGLGVRPAVLLDEGKP